MSLLLKALSRVEQRQQAAANDAQNPPVETPIPPVEPTVAAVEPAASVEQIDHDELSNVAPELPIADSFVEVPDTAGDFSTALDAAIVAEVRVDADSPTAEPIAVDSVADQPAPSAAPIVEHTLPVDHDAAIPTNNAETSAVEVSEPPADVPPPVADASETYTDFFADLRDDLGNEPIWRQLEDLQRLVASDLGRFDSETVSLEDSGDASIEVTKTEVLEIDAIDLPKTNVAPDAVTPPPGPSATSIPLATSAEQYATEFPPFQSIFEPVPTPPEPVEPAALLNFKPEFRELRDQLLARINIAKHPTLLMVDAGQNIGDSSWLLPLATSIIEKLNATKRDTPPQVLIVEAAGSDCGIAQTLGLDAHLGLNHVLARRTDWQTTVQSTPHPQIKLLGRGAGQLRSSDFNRLAKCWAELSLQFDLILVSAGPVYEAPAADQIHKSPSSSATLFFPLTTAAVLCIELNGTPQAAAIEAKRFLDARGIQVLGCIVQPTW